jgi:short-subunit dehydrogenase
MSANKIQLSSFNVDVEKTEEVKAFASQILKATDRIDILINNAGIYVPGSIYNEPEGQLEKMLSVNLISAYHLTRSLVPSMMKRKAGHIFNISSIAALKAYSNGGSYSISKWAMEGFSKNLREELMPFGIKVTTVHPGATMTSSWDGSGINPERIMETSDIAKMIIAASKLSPQACVEDIVIRPLLGDL